MTVEILTGDAAEVLRTLQADSVQCVVTSPPYYGLRSYDGGTAEIGREATPEAYVARLVETFREVRRVLRPDGTLWLNLGDCYAAGGSGASPSSKSTLARHGADGRSPYLDAMGKGVQRRPTAGYKPKDLLGIPWQVAFALRADGWFLRSSIVWAKPNPMPESVRDRPTSAHEMVFLLTRSPSYFYDAVAIAEPATMKPQRRSGPRSYGDATIPLHRRGTSYVRGEPGLDGGATRNARNVWTIAPKPYKGAHFAVMPEALVERCVRAGTSERGACPHCGAAWARRVQRPDFSKQPKRATSKDAHLRNGDRTSAGQAWQDWRNANPDVPLGWFPSCDCPPHDPIGQTVLDPFGGSGTVGAVAQRLGRSATLIDLNPAYCDLAAVRVLAAPVLAEAAE